MSKIIPFPVPGSRAGVCEADIELAIARGIERYFDDCHQAVPDFIDRHFHYPGAVATNRVALGWDMLRAPLNLFWAPVYALACLLKLPLRHTPGLRPLSGLLERVPAGFTTQVQQHISSLILRDLLNQEPSRRSLEEAIVDSLQDSFEQHSGRLVGREHFHHLIEPLLADALNQYQVTRTAAADITNSLSCTVLGAFAFQKFTPGGIGIGLMLSSVLAKWSASREFVLGETLGGWYYSVFAPEPSLAMTTAAMLVVMTLLAAFAALSGVIIDPIQAAVGLHRRRLHKLLDHLQQDLLNSTRGNSYRPKDQFVARIMDTFDMIKSGLV